MHSSRPQHIFDDWKYCPPLSLSPTRLLSIFIAKVSLEKQDFPGGPVLKNQPSNAGHVG